MRNPCPFTVAIRYRWMPLWLYRAALIAAWPVIALVMWPFLLIATLSYEDEA